MMNKKTTPYMTLSLMMILIIFLFVGKYDVSSPGEGGTQPPLTAISLKESPQYYKSLGNDFLRFLREYNKTGAIKLNKSIKNKIIPEIAYAQTKLEELKLREKDLNSMLMNIPREEYLHNKLELSSFIVNELKQESLVYEIVYNYDNVPSAQEEQEGTEEEGYVEETTSTTSSYSSYSNKFMIKIYQINEDNNYEKVTRVMNDIFIKEPYEIAEMEMGFDNISESYYLMLVIQI